MVAAMCTLIPHDYEIPQPEESGRQLAMKTVESGSNEKANSMETHPKDPAFSRLPDEIIELILRFTDSNSFASLIILNKKWRRISQQPQLYAYHLSRCRSYSASHHEISGPLTDADLPRLRSIFAKEVKRNIFDCYLRPRETLIKLVSTSISSSAAFPGGEAFHFSFSPNGHHLLAYSSSRIFVLDTAAEEVVVTRELKILRRPTIATVLDDGSILALLSTDHQVDIYDLSSEKPKHTRVVALDHSPRTIALSPEGSVLAIGFEGGVEVYSLAANALPTDKRAVKCDASDILSFSPDGTQLLGTTLHSQNPSTVILTAPYYNPVSHLPEESISQLWTTSILFPNSSRDCSHATLLPSTSENDASWTFTYDKVFESFRAVRIDDLRNGTTYFTGPATESSSMTKLTPSTLPTANLQGEIVAAGFQGRQIWLYGIPEDLDAAPEIVHNLSGNGESTIPTPTSDPRTSVLSQESLLSRIPQWQNLADRLRNTFVEGRNVADLDGAKAMKWVSQRQGYHSERLIVVAPGIVEQQLDGEEDGLVPIDGGRILLLDFQYGTSNGEKRTLTIEVGNREPQVLEEEQRDMDAEVAIVRRRTIAARRRTNPGGSGQLGTVAIPSLPATDAAPSITKSPSHLAAEAAQRFRNLQIANEDNVSLADEEQEEVFDAPYSHTSPRSGNTLRRAATVAANHRRLHPRVVVAQGPVGMRRTDGTELPHESDADNWVPPPPPYSREPIEPLPEHLRNAILAGKVRTLNRLSPRTSPRPGFATLGDGDGASLHRSRSTNSPRLAPLQRTVSDEITVSSRDFTDIDVPRPSSSPLFINDLDIYDVSSPSSPRPITTRSAEPVSPETNELSSPAPDPVSTTDSQSQSQRLMRATLLQPVSPIPQPIQAWERASAERRLEDWETTNSDQVSTINLEGPQSVTLNRLQAPVPARPNDDHHVIFFNNSPSVTEHDTEIERSTTRSASDISLTLPEALPELVSEVQQLVQSPIFYEGGLERPSDDQIARLNSRTGRPPARILADPSRRRSGSGSSPLEVAAASRRSFGSGFDVDLRRFSNSPIAIISEEQEPRSSPPRNLPGSSGSECSTGESQASMPPISLLDSNPRSRPDTNPVSTLTNLLELGSMSDADLNGDVFNNTIANELPVFAPQPVRPTYPSNADRRNSGYSTPPRINTPPRPRSGTGTPPRSFSPSRSPNGNQSPIRRRPVSTYNTSSSTLPIPSSNNTRRHSGLAFEISSSNNSGIGGNPRLQYQVSNPNFGASPLMRLDTIRSVEAGSDGEKDANGGFGRNGAGMRSAFSNWGRSRSSGNVSQRNRKRESADWGELLGSVSAGSGGNTNGNNASQGGGDMRIGTVMSRNRSTNSENRLSMLDGRGTRSDRAISKENKKRRGKKGLGAVKCAVM